MNLHDYDIVILNSSAGKDSLCVLWVISQMAREQDYPSNRIVVSHQDLQRMEWKETRSLAKIQADLFNFKIYYSTRVNEAGQEEDLLGYVRRRKMWPSKKQRGCTSDFKRGPGGKIVVELTKDLKESRVLYVFGFRAQESPERAKRKSLSVNKKLSYMNAHGSRIVRDYLPIRTWSTKKVWKVIRDNRLPYHSAYDLGMPRLSCVFCIFSPFDALVIAGRANPQLLDEYIEVEQEIGHTFRDGFAIASVRDAIQSGYEPKNVPDWVM